MRTMQGREPVGLVLDGAVPWLGNSDAWEQSGESSSPAGRGRTCRNQGPEQTVHRSHKNPGVRYCMFASPEIHMLKC